MHRKCKTCGKIYYSSDTSPKVWKCDCGAEIKKDCEVEMKGGKEVAQGTNRIP